MNSINDNCNWFPFSHNYSMSSGVHFLNPVSGVFQSNSTVTKHFFFVHLSQVPQRSFHRSEVTFKLHLASLNCSLPTSFSAFSTTPLYNFSVCVHRNSALFKTVLFNIMYTCVCTVRRCKLSWILIFNLISLNLIY